MPSVGAPPLFPSNPTWPEGLRIEVDHYGLQVELFQYRKKVGEVFLGPPIEFPMLGEVSQILESELIKKYQNRGIGKALYLVAMQEFGPIHPDWTGEVSPAAWRLWKSLQRLPFVDFISAEEVGVDFQFMRPTGRVYDLYRVLWPNPVPHAEFNTKTYVEWPKNWRGVLDQVYWLEEPLIWES